MSRQIDRKTTKQVRIDFQLHRLVKIEAAKSGETIKSLVEYALAMLLGPVSEKNGSKKAP